MCIIDDDETPPPGRVFKVENLTPTANPESNLTPSCVAPTGALGDRILDVLESLGGRA